MSPETRFQTPRNCTENNDKEVSLPRQIPQAQSIDTFTPSHSSGHDIYAYLWEINCDVQRLEHGTVQDLILPDYWYIKMRNQQIPQSATWHVQSWPKLLHDALIKEFSDPKTEYGPIAALCVKQGCQKCLQAYYKHVHQAYFEPRNGPDMEEDSNFKALFLWSFWEALGNHLTMVKISKSTRSVPWSDQYEGTNTSSPVSVSSLNG